MTVQEMEGGSSRTTEFSKFVAANFTLVDFEASLGSSRRF